jgi:chromosome segregation ATPase
MLRADHALLAPALALLLAAFVAGDAAAQKKIVCWKDKAGKVVGCGDSVPPEYQDNATKELDRRGITRQTTETAEERARREAAEKQTAAEKAEEKKRLAEQRRQDQALLNTFTNEKEIDLKRDRDLQVVDGQLTQLRVSHKNAVARQAEVKGRIDAAAKTGKPMTANQKEDLERAQSDMDKAEQSIVIKEKEKEDIRKKYADMRARYTELRSGGSAPATTAAKK